MSCIMKENSQIFPFFFFDKSQLSRLKLLESYDVKSKLTSMPGMRSFSVHHDELRLLLNALKCCLDIIGISETKEPGDGFPNNVTLNGYDLHSKYSNSAAGGVAIYIRSNLDYIIRDDLSIVEDEFETLWVEIKNNKFQNVLCCCAYRHPNTDVEKFINYMDKIMTKIVKENKLVFLYGRF